MSWVYPYNCLFTSTVSLRQSSQRQSSQRHLQQYDHISFLQPHKRYESHFHMKLIYDKEQLRNEQGERVQDEHVDHALWIHTVWSWVR